MKKLPWVEYIYKRVQNHGYIQIINRKLPYMLTGYSNWIMRSSKLFKLNKPVEMSINQQGEFKSNHLRSFQQLRDIGCHEMPLWKRTMGSIQRSSMSMFLLIILKRRHFAIWVHQQTDDSIITRVKVKRKKLTCPLPLISSPCHFLSWRTRRWRILKVRKTI